MALFDVGLVNGKDGKSAYQYAKDAGYKGTESEFAETLADIGVTLTSTLTAGQTTLTFIDEKITANSVLNAVYTSIFGVSVKSAEFIDGSLTLEFVKQDEDMDVEVLIDAAMADGIHGEDGEVGADGKSAYEYAQDGGFEGTEEEFAELLGNDIEEIKDTVGYTAGKNLLENTATTKEVFGITYTINEDKSVTINGTASGNTSIVLNTNLSLPNGEYILSGCPDGGGIETYYLQLGVEGRNYRDYGQGGKSFVITDTLISEVKLFVYSGQTVDNLTFYPMIRKADITDDTYEPYNKPDVDTRLGILERNKITSGTTDLTAGTSTLASGTIYCVYE